MDKDARAMKKRLYFREKKRMQRQEIRDEADMLKHRIAQLEVALREHHSQGSVRNMMLSWKDLAVVFRENMDVSLHHKSDLAKKCESYRKFASEMQRWIHVNTTSRITRKLDDTFTWRNVTLFADPQTREAGKQWITMHMYHHTAAMFRHHDFPPSMDDKLYSINVADDGQTVVHRSQSVMPVSAAVMVTTYTRYLCEILMVNGPRDIPEQTLMESSTSTVVHRLTTQHATPEVANLLVGQFYDESSDTTTVVVRQVLDDEQFPHGCRQRHRLVWMEVRAVSPSQCKARHLHMFSQSCLASGVVVPFTHEVAGFIDDRPDEPTSDQYYDLLLTLDTVVQKRVKARLALVAAELAQLTS